MKSTIRPVGLAAAACGIALAVAWFGCDTKGEGITIGSVLSLSGEKAAYGYSAKNGMELAVGEINSSGGIHGRKLAVIYEDGKGSPKDALNAFQKLVSVNKVAAVIGPLTSSEVLALAPVAEKNRVIVLSPAASSPEITKAGDYIFRNCPSDIYEGSIMAEVARSKLGLTRLAVIYVNSDYGVGLRDAFVEKFAELKGTVVTTQAYPDNARDFRTQLLNIKAESPEAVYMIGYKEVGSIVKQAKEIGLSAKFLSTALFEDAEVLKTAGDSAEGVIFTTSTYDPGSKDPVIQKFVDGYKQRFGKDPDIFAALSYDAMRILARAIEAGGLSAEEIKRELYRIKDFPGLLGKISVDANGDVVLPVVLKTVKDGRFILYQ